MPQTEFSAHLGRTIKPLLFISCLLLILAALPAGVDAAPPVGAETCAECHVEETEAWQDSPHAHAVDEQADIIGATCEDCHGPYVEDHPEAGLMKLTMDSSVCDDCHANTFGQWENSMHAQAGVQCIGCHLSHSQKFRLTDQTLCSSCHQTRVDTAHGQADVACIECHLSSAVAGSVDFTNATQLETGLATASHDFTSVFTHDCLNCHGQDVHQDDSPEMLNVSSLEPDCNRILATKLDDAQQTNKRLMTIAPVSLGLGMGIGGMLGIIFMLVIGYINQRMTQP